MSCKGICHRYKATKPSILLTIYGTWQKRCTFCDVFMQWDGTCCCHALRVKPKKLKNKQQLMITQQVRMI